MKQFGCLCIILSAAIILYHVVFLPLRNKLQFRDHPFRTILTAGSNLKERYTFKPPFTRFEWLTVGLGVVGVVAVYRSKK